MSDREDVVARINTSLFGIVRDYDRFRAAFARELDVSLTELRAISRIFDGTATTPKQLAVSLDLTTGAVTALLDRLADAGYVTRRPHPSDRRSFLLVTTESGSELMQRVTHAFEDTARIQTADLDDERLEAFSELLAGFVERGRDIRPG